MDLLVLYAGSVEWEELGKCCVTANWQAGM